MPPMFNLARGAALALALLPLAVSSPAYAHHDHHPQSRPTIYGHRGAAGYRPEHTLAAYRLGARMGADYIEPDLVSTKDHVLVARHENEIGGTTNVGGPPGVAAPQTTKRGDGGAGTRGVPQDFTPARLKTLPAQEGRPGNRP